MCLRAHGCEMLGGGVITSILFTVATYTAGPSNDRTEIRCTEAAAADFGIRRFIRFNKRLDLGVLILSHVQLR